MDAFIGQLIRESKMHSCPGKEICVCLVAAATLPTIHGDFTVMAFTNNLDSKEHAAFLAGDVFEKDDVPVRIHSECLTGDAVGSLRCDCKEQLERSLDTIGKMKFGILLYLRQEGRGIGFVNKIKAYQLQDKGYDTNEANKALGFRPDERDYAIAAHMLSTLKIKSIKLISNNPEKVKNLKQHGVKITGMIPVVVQPNNYNKFYLETKEKSGHIFHDFEQSDSLLK